MNSPKRLSPRGAQRPFAEPLGRLPGDPSEIFLDCRARQAGLAMTNREFVSENAQRPFAVRLAADRRSHVCVIFHFLPP